MDYRSVAGEYTAERVIEKSRFISYVAHAAGEEEARAFLDRVRKEHPLATHVCWAYISDRIGNLQRFSDDGEPQGTAGMPILGVLKAQELRETAVAVVRYFGGIKLGTSGLIVAYRTAASEALTNAKREERTVDDTLTVLFEYPFMNDVMRIVKEEQPDILEQSYDMDCRMTLRIRRSMMNKLRARLEKVETLRVADEED